MSQKPVPHSTSSRVDDIKAEKCGPKLIILSNLFYDYRRRRRTNSNLNGRVPSLLIKFSPEERTAYVMHPIIDSSQTHGTRPDSGDSSLTPNTVFVSLPLLFHYVPPLFPFSFFFILHTNYSIQCGCSDRSDCTMCVSHTWGLPIRKLNIIAFMASCLSHMCSFSICAFSSPLYATI